MEEKLLLLKKQRPSSHLEMIEGALSFGMHIDENEKMFEDILKEDTEAVLSKLAAKENRDALKLFEALKNQGLQNSGKVIDKMNMGDEGEKIKEDKDG